MRDILNEIAEVLLCPLSKTLATDPVLCEDGHVYEEKAIETLRSNSNPYCVPLKSCTPFHPKLRRIVEILVSSGEIDDDYLGSWADASPSTTRSAADEESNVVEIGEKYLCGTDVQRDEKRAYEYFERASAQGDITGDIRRADCLLTGTGVKKDHEEGHQILVEAALSDKSVPATLRLICFYAEGIFGYEESNISRARWVNHLEKISCTDQDGIKEKVTSLKESLKIFAIQSPTIDVGPSSVEESNINRHEVDSDSIVTSADESHHTVYETSSGKAVKKCIECDMLKPQTEFTATQWKKKANVVMCRACVAKLPSYQPIQQQKKICCSCGLMKTFESFTISQWRKKVGDGRCCLCVKKGTLDHIPPSSL